MIRLAYFEEFLSKTTVIIQIKIGKRLVIAEPINIFPDFFFFLYEKLRVSIIYGSIVYHVEIYDLTLKGKRCCFETSKSQKCINI